MNLCTALPPGHKHLQRKRVIMMYNLPTQRLLQSALQSGLGLFTSADFKLGKTNVVKNITHIKMRFSLSLVSLLMGCSV